jgi:hypothetical protein
MNTVGITLVVLGTGCWAAAHLLMIRVIARRWHVMGTVCLLVPLIGVFFIPACWPQSRLPLILGILGFLQLAAGYLVYVPPGT